jgi:hypothetical protein
VSGRAGSGKCALLGYNCQLMTAGQLALLAAAESVSVVCLVRTRRCLNRWWKTALISPIILMPVLGPIFYVVVLDAPDKHRDAHPDEVSRAPGTGHLHG